MTGHGCRRRVEFGYALTAAAFEQESSRRSTRLSRHAQIYRLVSRHNLTPWTELMKIFPASGAVEFFAPADQRSMSVKSTMRSLP